MCGKLVAVTVWKLINFFPYVFSHPKAWCFQKGAFGAEGVFLLPLPHPFFNYVVPQESEGRETEN